MLVAGTLPLHAAVQHFVYLEPGNAACPAAAVAAAETVAPKRVPVGMPLPGSLSVSCGFARGSYTVTLSASDPAAVFTPRSFLVNFGHLAGDGAFTVTFATAGSHRVTSTVTSNMGSPAVPGRFVSASSEFDVVQP